MNLDVLPVSYTFGQHVVTWVQERLGTDDFGPATGIGILRHRKLAAGVLYNGFTKGAICMHIATDGTKRWMTKEFLWMAFDYPFNQLGCRRVTGLVDEDNVEARKFNEHLGFELETRMVGAAPMGDVLIYRMWKEDCRFINLN